jgi:murein L,D-transpeptidase YcbB/YkuD
MWTWRSFALGLTAACVLAAAPAQASVWRADQAELLRRFAVAASDDALPLPDTRQLDEGLRAGEGPALDAAATGLALILARMHLLGVAPPEQRSGWRIADSDQAVDIPAWLERALAADGLSAFLASLRPAHPDYAALRAAYAGEGDPARRRVLALNMERWRWLPRRLGDSHLLVNAAAFEVRLWRSGKPAGTWPVIVGKTTTPTPVFSASVTGVTFNPWWNIPASIVREKRGRFPASQGYVRVGGQWRQKPGPGNALGQMKLVMPNPYNVYLHDTPSKSLFSRETRAFSHGCIRVGDAVGFTATLVGPSKSRQEVDAMVKAGATVTVDLPERLPVYVTYFTAAPGSDGQVRFHPDIYGRDGQVRTTGLRAVPCGNDGPTLARPPSGPQAWASR